MGLFSDYRDGFDASDPTGEEGGGSAGTPPPPGAPIPPGGGVTGGPAQGGPVPAQGFPGSGPSGPAGGPPEFNWSPPPYMGPSSPQFNFAPVPEFKPLAFNAPDFKNLANDPSYQFRLHQGLEALASSNAAKGMSRTGGSYKGLIDYAGSAASQEENNIFQRAVDTYNLQEGAQRDQYAPQLAAWQAKTAAATQGGLSAFNQAYNMYTFPITEERLREQMILDAWARAAAGTQQGA